MFIVGESYLLPTIELMVMESPERFVVMHEHVGDVSGHNHMHLNKQFVPDHVLKMDKSFDRDILACAPKRTEMKVMVCQRPYEPIKNYGHSLESFFIVQRQVRKRIKTCDVCPHQGCDLSNVPETEIRGRTAVVCPCHGLAWSTENGEMIIRKPKK